MKRKATARNSRVRQRKFVGLRTSSYCNLLIYRFLWIAFGEADVQTIEEAVVNNENLEFDAEQDPEIGYWKTVVANRKVDIERIKKMNDKVS